MNSTSQPAVLRSRLPESIRFARIPQLAQVAINVLLSKKAASLILYYMSESDGFAPAAHLVYTYTGLKQPNMITARKELIEKGFIAFDKTRNEITICWEHILEVGRVALMLAEREDVNVKEVLRGGVFHPERPRKMKELIEGYRDSDAREDVVSQVSEAYQKANGEKLERLNEVEFQRWLATGCPYPTQLPVDPGYREPVEVSMGLKAEPSPDNAMLETVPNDVEAWDDDGGFLIEGLTREEYESWKDAEFGRING